MTGVEILSSETIYNTILPGWCMGLGLLFGIISVFSMVKFIVDGNDVLPWVFLVLTAASIVVSCLGAAPRKTDIDHIEYKVTIDDSVSMNEFLDKYEILDQEGEIYTVKERE